MKNKINFALLGCGGVADLYMPVFKHLDEAGIAAIIDTDQVALQEIAGKYNIQNVYTNAADAANDNSVDAVIVGTPPNLHAEHVELFASRGKHILCEKPMAGTVEDCRKIINSCKKHNVKLQLGHMKRFMRGNQKVKAIIDSGALGKVYMAECSWDVAVPWLIDSYREKTITAGGTLQDHGPHSFDLIRWWTGADIKEVSASIRIIHPGRPTEDTAVVTLEHENGVTSYHHMTRLFYGLEMDHDFYRIYGTNGTLIVRNSHHFPTMSLESPEIALYRSGQCIQHFNTFHGWNIDDSVIRNFPFYNQLKSFCECILEDGEPRISGEDGIHTIEAVTAAYVSAWKNVKVGLPYEKEVNFTELFKDLKKREEKNLVYNYTIDTELPPPLTIDDPVLSYRPPRTKEKWSDTEHGLSGKAELKGIHRRLKYKDQ